MTKLYTIYCEVPIEATQTFTGEVRANSREEALSKAKKAMTNGEFEYDGTVSDRPIGEYEFQITEEKAND